MQCDAVGVDERRSIGAQIRLSRLLLRIVRRPPCRQDGSGITMAEHAIPGTPSDPAANARMTGHGKVIMPDLDSRIASASILGAPLLPAAGVDLHDEFILETDLPQ